MTRFYLFVLILVHSSCFAANPYINKHEEGWYWHNEPKIVHKKLEKKKAFKPTQQRPIDHDKIWKLIGKKVAVARAKAILNPTPSNIAIARKLQRQMVAQASLFSEKWMLSLLLNPEQDESLINPNSNGARGIYNQMLNAQKEEVITEISKSSGLFYFYQGGEPYSEEMAKVVDDFARVYQMPVIPVAMTHQFSSLFPNSQVDSGLANQMGVKHIPALFALNPTSKKFMPIAYGLVSQSELKENILLASQAFAKGESHA